MDGIKIFLSTVHCPCMPFPFLFSVIILRNRFRSQFQLLHPSSFIYVFLSPNNYITIRKTAIKISLESYFCTILITPYTLPKHPSFFHFVCNIFSNIFDIMPWFIIIINSVIFYFIRRIITLLIIHTYMHFLCQCIYINWFRWEHFVVST